MPMEVRKQVEQCMQSFMGKPLRESAIGLLNSLGYHSEKTLDIGGSPTVGSDERHIQTARVFRKD